MKLLTGTRYAINEYHFATVIGSRRRDLYRVARELIYSENVKPEYIHGAYETEAEALEAFERLTTYMATRITRQKFEKGNKYEASFDMLELERLNSTGCECTRIAIKRYIAQEEG